MAVTRSTAAERQKRPAARWGAGALPGLRPSRAKESVLLLAAALVVTLGWFLVYRAATAPWADFDRRVAAGEAVDLNSLERAEQLLPFFDGFGSSAERTFLAARVAQAGHERKLPNVGEIGRLRVSAADLAANPGLTELRARMAERKKALPPPAAQEGSAALEAEALTVPLFTPDQVRRLKERFVVRTPQELRSTFLSWCALILAAFLAVHLFWRFRGFGGDPLFLPLVLLLSGTGLAIMVSVRDPLRDLLVFRTFAQGVVGGCVLLALASLLDFERPRLRGASFLPLAGALGLSLLLIVFGSGPGGSDAKVNLFGFQPVELIKILVVFFLAGYLFERWEFLRELTERRPILAGAERLVAIPKLEYLLPPIAAIGLVLLFFFFQRDLGPALVMAFLFLVLYSIARGRPRMLLAGALTVASAFFVGYKLGVPHTVSGRIAMWLAPWDNAARGGEHLAHSLWAFASGSGTGSGLGLGSPQHVPAVHTDMVLAAVAEELGFLGLLAVAALYALLVQRGLRAARRAEGVYSFFLATGLTLLLALQMVLITGGVLGLFPLSGVVSPFLSSGRTAMLTNFAVVGMLAAVSARGGKPLPLVEQRFRGGSRALQAALGLLLVALLGKAAWVQLLRPDPTLVRGTLALQGDGSRRFVYNPRLVEIARGLPRGSILDRNGLPLATSDPAELTRHQAEYAKLGVDVETLALPEPGGRIYPFGGRTFHLLGDLASRLNWAARNTSYAERDSRIRLQGYDDFAGLIEVGQPDGRVTREIALDYGELIPLLRHRHQPDHPAVRRILDRDRTLRLTVDARLQVKTAEIVARFARPEGHGAAAVVLDPVSGDLLASVSYPWPEGKGARPARPPRAGAKGGAPLPTDIDRARYGLYPPGSTFKLVTAMAALRKGPETAAATYDCKMLSDGRVGNYVRGWGRPVRDDPTDEHPHGTVDLETGLAVSCNAYFAQLATYGVKAEGLLETAKLLGISVATPNTAQQLQDALPQAGYGQGQVVATPFQMARVAATVAAGGASPEGRWVLDETNTRRSPPVPLLPMAQAARLAAAMRRVVTEGTAATYLSAIEPSIAGKTGTAEVQGKKSHSWFIGYAPYGAGGRKLSFAVVVEHGGYGGRLAAPAAGEIVKAAAELGLIR